MAVLVQTKTVIAQYRDLMLPPGVLNVLNLQNGTNTLTVLCNTPEDIANLLIAKLSKIKQYFNIKNSSTANDILNKGTKTLKDLSLYIMLI